MYCKLLHFVFLLFSPHLYYLSLHISRSLSKSESNPDHAFYSFAPTSAFDPIISLNLNKPRHNQRYLWPELTYSEIILLMLRPDSKQLAKVTASPSSRHIHFILPQRSALLDSTV